MSAIVVDVGVIGGGPAGSTVATRLAQLGHRVALFDRGGVRRRSAETLAAGTVDLLAMSGADVAVCAAGFPAVGSASMTWDGPAATRPLPPGTLLVDRERFDALLLEQARRCGVMVVRPAVVGDRTRDPEAWRLDLDAGIGEATCRFLVDASGRPARSRRAARTGPPLLAVSGRWLGPGLPGRPAVIALDHGWCWCVPVAGVDPGPAMCDITVFVDPGAWRSMPGGSPAARYRLLVGDSGIVGVPSARPIGRVTATDATGSLAADIASEHHLVVGDAALALDPLSSTGVQKAIQTALTAAVVVHTVLTRPDDTAIALDHHRHSLAAAAAHHVLWTGESYAAVAATRPMPFWTARAVVSAEPEPTPRAHVRDDVDPARVVRLSPLADFVEVTQVCGDLITAGSALRHPALDGPVAYLGGTAIVPLLAALDGPTALVDVARTWASALPTRTALHIAGWLYQRGVLEEVDAA